MVIGGVPFTTLQSIMTSYPLYTYTGVPILTLFMPFVITDGFGTCDPLSISGGSGRSNVHINVTILRNYY